MEFEKLLYTSKTGEVSVPHAEEMPYRLSDGKEITIKGTVGDGESKKHGGNSHGQSSGDACDDSSSSSDSDCEVPSRFSINLLDGADYESSNVILHFNPRIDSETVVLNSRDEGSWGEEENGRGFPFRPNTPYEVKIKVKEDAYHILVQWENCAEYVHRLPMERARYLYIFGDTTIQNIIFDDHYNPIHRNPHVPFTTDIPKGVYPGRVIFIEGFVKDGAERFHVNLQCGEVFDSCDIAFHMDNRITFGQGNTVVRTHKAGGDWGSEEDSQDSFPFTPGHPFIISIMVDESSYLIAINEKHFAEFKHRIPYQTVSHLHVVGDCDLLKVRFA